METNQHDVVKEVSTNRKGFQFDKSSAYSVDQTKCTGEIC